MPFTSPVSKGSLPIKFCAFQVPIDNAWGALDMVNNIIKEDAP